VEAIITCFHGGKETIVGPLRVSNRGTFGSGYYGGDLACAVEFCGGDDADLICLEMDIKKPFRYRANFDHELDFDSPAVDMINAIFGPEEQSDVLATAMQSDGYFGNEVQERLLELGYDGIFVDYGEGAFESVAFFPDQIHHVSTHTLEEAKLMLRPHATKGPAL